jgi:hypothetical protein
MQRCISASRECSAFIYTTAFTFPKTGLRMLTPHSYVVNRMPPLNTVRPSLILESFHSRCSLAALAAGLDSVEWLSSQSSHDTRHTSVGEIGDNSLWDLLLGLVVFQNVVRAHSKRSGTRLLQCCSSKATVKTQDAVFLPDSRHRVRRASESSLIPRVVYQRSLHTLGGRDCKKTCDDTAHHAGPKTP